MTATTKTLTVREQLAAAREDATKLRALMKNLKEKRAAETAARKQTAEMKRLLKAAAKKEREEAREAKAAERLAKITARNAKAQAKIDKMMAVGKGLAAVKRATRKPSAVTVTTAEGTKTVPATKSNKKAK
jgi:chromosome segregation ATPase